MEVEEKIKLMVTRSEEKELLTGKICKPRVGDGDVKERPGSRLRYFFSVKGQKNWKDSTCKRSQHY